MPSSPRGSQSSSPLIGSNSPYASHRRGSTKALPSLVREHITSARGGEGVATTLLQRFRRQCGAIRPAVWETLHVRASKYGHLTNYWPSRIVEIFICLLVMANVALGATFSELVDWRTEKDPTRVSLTLFKVHEYFWWLSALFFTAEYVARLWSCVEEHEKWREARHEMERHLLEQQGGIGAVDELDGSGSGNVQTATAAPTRSEDGDKKAHCCMRRLRWMFKPLSIFDLACAVMFYSPIVYRFISNQDYASNDEREFFQDVSWFRLLLLLRLERQLKAMKRVIQVMRQSQVELLSSSFFTLVNILYIAVIFFWAEHHSNDEIDSLLDALYWTVETITTLGYGDIPPSTALGRAIACFACLMGMISFAIPAGVISASFIAVIYEEREENARKREAENAIAYEMALAAQMAEYDLYAGADEAGGDGELGSENDFRASREVSGRTLSSGGPGGSSGALLHGEKANATARSSGDWGEPDISIASIAAHDISVASASAPLAAAQHRVTTTVLAKMAGMLRASEERNDARMQQLYSLVAESMTGERSAMPSLIQRRRMSSGRESGPSTR